jgi:hypothetical protein
MYNGFQPLEMQHSASNLMLNMKCKNAYLGLFPVFLALFTVQDIAELSYQQQKVMIHFPDSMIGL